MSKQPDSPMWRVCTNDGTWEEVSATNVVTEPDGWARLFLKGELVALFYKPSVVARK